MKKPIKHLIECHCVLPQYRNLSDPFYHKFSVFSEYDEENDEIQEKFANCNNCGVTHKIIDVCKSEIVVGSEDIKTLSYGDFSKTLPKSLFELLIENNCEICDFEYAQFILDYNLFEDDKNFLILSRETVDNSITGKLLRFISNDKFRVEQYKYTNIVG